MSGGFIMNNSSSPIGSAKFVGTKSGEACATNILGLFSQGDASVRKAATNGNIIEIGTVDVKISSFLGLFATECTVVTGK